MPRVTYVQANGRKQRVQVPNGDSLMDGALDNGVAGILAQCGGGCTCLTCHCFVASPWLELLPPATQDEDELLDYLPDRQPSSRLACQVRMEDRFEGMVVHVPSEQI